MNNEQKRIAIAEACGWIKKENWYERQGGDGTRYGVESIPDYFNDLNAMHEAEEVVNTDEYRENLSTVYGRETARYDFERATASQRAEAFGITLGLWKEVGDE